MGIGVLMAYWDDQDDDQQQDNSLQLGPPEPLSDGNDDIAHNPDLGGAMPTESPWYFRPSIAKLPLASNPYPMRRTLPDWNPPDPSIPLGPPDQPFIQVPSTPFGQREPGEPTLEDIYRGGAHLHHGLGSRLSHGYE